MTAITPASPGYASIARQLSARTGIAVSRTPEDFARALGNTLQEAGLSDLEELAERLSAGMFWDELIAQVTVGETYFFRCPEHFAWIRERVMPGLRQRCESGQPLRIWSAGCASGEEAYSLAIVLHEAGLLERSYVLGSDVSTTALAKARAAQYREWAFRAVDEAFIARYFDNPNAALRCLNPQLREHVEFAKINLATDLYPNAANGTRDMDLILCRNVLIYFDFDTIGRVARQLYDALAPGGWLLTGPSDPMLSEYAPFEVVLPGNGICYRRPKLRVAQSAFPTQRTAAASPRQLAREPIVSSLRSSPVYDRAARADTVTESVPAERAAATELEQAISAVQSAWNTVDSVAAQLVCQQAIAKHPNSPELRYLLAVALLDAGNLSDALAAIRQALYLDRTLSIAHFTLGSILERMHDPEAARRAYRNAYEGACAQAPDELVRLSDGIVASGLAAAASRAIAALSGSAQP